MNELTAGVARELLDYDPATGVLVWRHRSRDHFSSLRSCNSWNGKHSGNLAGTVNNHGYFRVRLFGRNYGAHRIAWLITNGAWPAGQIDHINGITSDNRLVNLRCVTSQENGRNAKRKSNNTSGITGVYWRKPHGKWCAAICVGEKKKHLGYFTNIFDAACARKSAELEHGFHPNHGRG